MKLFTVNSLSHSGSTILSISLASHAKLVSLGEVFQVLREPTDKWFNDTETLCSCGEVAGNCAFWGKVLTRIQKTLPSTSIKYDDLAAKYDIVVDVFNELYGDELYIVDTSKGDKHLQYMIQSNKVEPQAFFLVRDVRSYVNSQMKTAAKQNRKGLKKIKGHAWFQYLKWYLNNKKRLNALKELNIPTITLGYEEFCFETETVLQQLCQFAEISSSEKMGSLEGAKHHILVGNRLRLDDKKLSGIRYDGSWLKNNKLNLPAMLFRFIMKFNAKNVYGNTSTLTKR